MKKKTLTLFCLMCFLGLSLQAQQEVVSQGSLQNLSYLQPANLQFMEFSEVNRVQGSPYFREQWDLGRILFIEYDDYTDKLGVSLDLETHQLYVKLDNGFVGKLPVEKVESVIIYVEEGDSVVWSSYNLNRDYKMGSARRLYYEEIFDGEKFTLLHGQEKYLRKEEYVENLGMVRRPDKYMSRDTYWMIYRGKMVQMKNCNERALCKALPSFAPKIKRYAKKGDLNLKDHKDVRYLLSQM